MVKLTEIQASGPQARALSGSPLPQPHPTPFITGLSLGNTLHCEFPSANRGSLLVEVNSAIEGRRKQKGREQGSFSICPRKYCVQGLSYS